MTSSEQHLKSSTSEEMRQQQHRMQGGSHDHNKYSRLPRHNAKPPTKVR